MSAPFTVVTRLVNSWTAVVASRAPSFGSRAASAVPVARLYANAPNPFNPVTTIRYDIPRQGPVSLKVYDVSGRLVRTLVDGYQGPGTYEAVWNGQDGQGAPVASGVYFYRLDAVQGLETRRMVLVK
jgi:hypothetical protein